MDPGWSRQQVQDYLLAHGFTLTSNEDDSIIESVISCLLQHHRGDATVIENLTENRNSGHFWLSDSQEIIKSVVRDEKQRIPILIDLVRTKQMRSANRHQERELDQIIQEAIAFIQKWKLIKNPIRVYCLSKSNDIIQVNSEKHDEKRQKDDDSLEVFLWQNNDTGCFDNIIRRRLLFENEEDYMKALIQDFRRIRNCFFRQINCCQDVKREAFRYREKIENCFSPQDYLQNLNDEMDAPAKFIFEQLKTELTRSGRKQLTEEMERDLKEEITRSLSADVEDVYLNRRADYDKKYSEEIQRKNQLQMENKAMQLAMKLLEGKVKQNDHFIAKVFWRWRRFAKKKLGKRQHDQVSSAVPQTEGGNKADDHQRKTDNGNMKTEESDNKKEGATAGENKREWAQQKELLAWMKFQDQLRKCVPSYELAIMKPAKVIDIFLIINDPVQLVNAIFEKFSINLLDRDSLQGYVAKNANPSIDKMHEILEESFSEPQWSSAEQSTYRVTGSALVLSQIERNLPSECNEIHICASKIIYADCDWKHSGMNVALSAPRICIAEKSRIEINTDGQDAEPFSERKAEKGKRPGESGDDGGHGGAGGHAGDVLIECDNLDGRIEISACGGDGADGQDGGDGNDGIMGTDGRDGVLDQSHSEGFAFWNRGFRSRDGLLIKDDGTEGTVGQNGGKGGNAGSGGSGGKAGEVNLKINIGRENCTYNNTDGIDGQNGQPGEGGKGGGGGVHGRTRAKGFTIKDCWLFSGKWVEEVGKLEYKTYFNYFDNVLGYEIIKLADDKGRAKNGEKGQQGKAADMRCNATASKKAMADVTPLWAPTDSDENQNAANGNSAISTEEYDQSNDQFAEDETQLQDETETKTPVTLGTMMDQLVLNRKRKEHFERQLVAQELTQTGASFAENQEHIEVSDRRLEQLGQELQDIESLAKVSEQIIEEMQQSQSKYERREQRIAEMDQADGRKSSAEANTEDMLSTPIIPIASEIQPFNNKNGLQLLDALVVSLSADVQKSELLASLVQQLALRLKIDGKEWISVTSIVRPLINNFEELTQSLKYINLDIALAGLFNDSSDKETRDLLNEIRKAVRDKLLKKDQRLDKTEVFYYLRKLSWSPADIKDMLNSLEKLPTKSSTAISAKCRLKDNLCGKLMSSLASKQKKTEDAQWLETFLTNALECYVADKPEKQVASFFGDFIMELSAYGKHNKSILDGQGKSRLYELAARELKLGKETKETAIDESAINQKRILFSLRYSGKSVEMMDKYKKSMTTDSQFAKEVERIFHDHFWTAEWDHIKKRISSSFLQNEYCDYLQQSAERLKTNLEWQYCRHSFKEKLNICKKIITQLKDDKIEIEDIFKYLQEAQVSVIGTFTDIRGSDEKEKFINFLFSSNVESIKKANKSFVKTIQEKMGSEHADALENQMKQALYQYDRLIFSTEELALLNGIFEKIDLIMASTAKNKDLSNVWRDLIELHDKCWMDNFLDHWQTKNDASKVYHQIDEKKNELQAKWQRQCVDGVRNRIAEPSIVIRRMDILLEKLLLLTSGLTSLDQSLSTWRTLNEIKPQHLEEEIQKISQMLLAENKGCIIHNFQYFKLYFIYITFKYFIYKNRINRFVDNY